MWPTVAQMRILSCMSAVAAYARRLPNMLRPALHFLLITGCALALLAGCATPPQPPKPAPIPPKAEKKPSYWKGQGVVGEPSILISLSAQRAYFYKGDTLVGESVISSGKKKFETPTGSFKIIQKHKDHASNLYGDYVDEFGEVVQKEVDVTKDPLPEGATFRGAKMPYFLRFHGGTGMHAGRVPGYRASHGCVRLVRFMAEHFYNNSAYGTPVQVDP